MATSDGNTETPIDWQHAKGWLKDEERELLFRLAGDVSGKDTLILNIGVEFGASLACLKAGNPTDKIIAFDPDMSKVLEAGYGATLYELSSYSEQAFALIENELRTEGRELRLIFVDGDHGKAGVLLDATYADLLSPGGYILFQDCWDWDKGIGVVHALVPGVNAAVSEWYKVPDIARKFVELDGVGTTRVFMKLVDVTNTVTVKENDYDNSGKTKQPGAASNRGANPDLQQAGNSLAEHPGVTQKPKLPRRTGKNPGRGG